MNNTEMRELDAWIDVHVFNRVETWAIIKGGFFYRPEGRGYTSKSNEAWAVSFEDAKKHESSSDGITIHNIGAHNYTTDPAASRELEKKCLEQLFNLDSNAESGLVYDEESDKHLFFITHERTATTDTVHAETLELAWALFASKLFSK